MAKYHSYSYSQIFLFLSFELPHELFDNFMINLAFLVEWNVVDILFQNEIDEGSVEFHEGSALFGFEELLFEGGAELLGGEGFVGFGVEFEEEFGFEVLVGWVGAGVLETWAQPILQVIIKRIQQYESIIL